MSKLELTISPDYVRSWGIWEAVRELIQNAIDSHEAGHEMEITYNKNREQPTLQIVNRGVVLDKSTLLLGNTSKSGNPNARGQFGEGYKLAWLTLLRSNHQIWVRSGHERWIPKIEFSDTYNSNLLTVDVAKTNTFESDYRVEIRGLAECDWLAIKERFLFPPFVSVKEKEMIDLGGSKILLSRQLRGHLFVKGIWVGDLPGKYWFGYDLGSLKLDRDRRLADPWDLKYAIKNVLNDAAQQNKINSEDLWDLFQGDQWEESRIIMDMGDFGTESLAAKISEHFKKLNGEGSEIVPVESMQESIQAQHFGLKGIVVPKPIKRLVEQKEGKFEDRRSQKALDIKDRFGVESLSPEEIDNFTWAVDLLRRIQIDHPVVIVEFFGEKVMGTFNNGEVSVAKKILVDRKELISTIVHEIAHHQGDDGSVQHRAAIEEIFGRLVVELSK